MKLGTRQKELVTALLPLVLLMFGFASGEVTVRILDEIKFGKGAGIEKSSAFYIDPVTRLRVPVPGSRLGLVKINKLGFRGPDILDKVPPSTLRIAFLGSSTTYDANSPEARNWPELTIRKMATRLPTKCAIAFINAGLPGLSTLHMRLHFEGRVRSYAPDVVVILPGDITNDLQNELRSRGVIINDLVAPSWFAEHSLLWAKVEKNIRVVQLQRAAHRPEGKVRSDVKGNAREFESRLADLVQTVRASDALPVLVTLASRIRREQSPRDQVEAASTALYYNPLISIPQLIDARDEYNAAIRRVAHNLTIPLITGEDEIPATPSMFADSTHFTPAGSEIMARRVAHRLTDDAGFRAAMSRRNDACRGVATMADFDE